MLAAFSVLALKALSLHTFANASEFSKVPGSMKCNIDNGACLGSGACTSGAITRADAQIACLANPKCGAIFDMGCGGYASTSWYLCDKDAPLLDSSDGCVYVTKKVPGSMKCNIDNGGCLGSDGCKSGATTRAEAQAACLANPKCGAIFDMGCGGDASMSWYLCDKDVPLLESSDSCVHVPSAPTLTPFAKVPGSMKCNSDNGGCLGSGGCTSGATTRAEAEIACLENPKCGAIFDMGCGGYASTSWYLCDKDVPLLETSDGCVYTISPNSDSIRQGGNTASDDARGPILAPLLACALVGPGTLLFDVA